MCSDPKKLTSGECRDARKTIVRVFSHDQDEFKEELLNIAKEFPSMFTDTVSIANVLVELIHFVGKLL